MAAGDGSRAIVLVAPGGEEVVAWRIEGTRVDLATVDALARLQVAARRAGWSVRLRNPCADLRGLLELVGLAAVIAVVDDQALPQRLETRRHAEGGEQLGIEEVVEPRDLPP